MKSQQQSRIPLKMAVLNLVHELMHAFGESLSRPSCHWSVISGAKHDPEVSEDPACTPKDTEQNGRYLMSKYSNNGKKHNHEVLSPCTKVILIEHWKKNYIC